MSFNVKFGLYYTHGVPCVESTNVPSFVICRAVLLKVRLFVVELIAQPVSRSSKVAI